MFLPYTIQINKKLYGQFAAFIATRAVIEAYKLYRTVTSSLGYTLALQPIPLGDFDSDTSSFQYSSIIFEVIGFVAMVFLIVLMQKTIKTFNRNEFDLIRNNFTQDFYRLQREDTANDL